MRWNKKSVKHTCLGCLHAIAICLPILACVFRLGYVWFNKNAKDSYSDYVSIQQSNLLEGDTIIAGNLYTIAYKGGLLSGQTYKVLDGKTNIKEIFEPSSNYVVDRFTPSYENTRTRLIVYDTNNIQHNYFNWQNTSNEFYFYPYQNYTLQSNVNFNVITNTYVEDKLDNAFYYSTKQTLKDFHYYNENMSSDYSTYVSNLQSYFVVNVDYLTLFGVNPSSDYLYYVAINFMLNYLVTIELVLLAPEILLVFFELIRKLMFGLLDKTNERSY